MFELSSGLGLHQPCAEIGGTISVVDVATHTVVGTINLGLDSRPVEMAFDGVKNRLYVAGGG
ncbi:MAG: hypothetical protein Q8P23_03020, partial [bacterium]|nr:hypothetical protein [bacterium]